MATVRELLAQQSVEQMREILGASPRRFREELFNRLGVKAKGSAARGFRLNAKGDARAKRFLEILESETPIAEEVLAEVVRNFLYTRRALLSDALDFFEVEHDNGLTDQDLDFLAELPRERRAEARERLVTQGHAPEDVQLYFGFMGLES